MGDAAVRDLGSSRQNEAESKQCVGSRGKAQESFDEAGRGRRARKKPAMGAAGIRVAEERTPGSRGD